MNADWYLLKVLSPLDENSAKEVMAKITEVLPVEHIQFNGAKSNTIGVRTSSNVSWAVCIQTLNQEGYYVGEISRGEVHYRDQNAFTSIFFQTALYQYSTASEESLPDPIELNEWEFVMLPSEVQEYYAQNELIVWVKK